MKEKINLSPQLRGLTKLVGKAIGDYAMIADGDRILVAISGGKDSMLLWEMLKYFQRVAPVSFEILPVYVDIGIPGFPLDELKKYFQAQKTACRIVAARRLKSKSWDQIDCYVCSRERRKLLFDLGDRLKFDKIAMGHNLDDISETILLNLFYRGEIGAMCPKQEFFKGRFTIIRPLAYVHAAEIKELARRRQIKVFKGNKCPNDHDSQRMTMRRLLGKLEALNPAVKKNVITALRNIKTEYLP